MAFFLDVQDVRVVIGGHSILQDVNLSWHNGRVLVLSGLNGVGKTVFLNVISGYSRPCWGRVVWCYSRYGYSSAGLVALSFDNLTYITQNLLNANLSIKDCLNLVASSKDPDANEGKQSKIRRSLTGNLGALSAPHRFNGLLIDFGLEEHLEKKLFQLSGGQLRRLHLLLTYAKIGDYSEHIVIFDEPTTGLDKEAKRVLLDYIGKATAKGVQFIISSHDFDWIEKLKHSLSSGRFDSGVQVFTHFEIADSKFKRV